MRLETVKLLQDLNTNDYIKLIASSLKDNALKASYTIDPKLSLKYDDEEETHGGAVRYLNEL